MSARIPPAESKQLKTRAFMAKRKYNVYQLHADYGEVNEEYYNYREAFRRYQSINSPKTLYGITEQGDIEVIMSK